ncbi:hypothetical protein M885DRAFT_515737 [Pelagophyceae sp. CCMP2097]|nr:hypothetical protein M885DRAFT_515737 [Pelagophyceae sp. CCMP2097]
MQALRLVRGAARALPRGARGAATSYAAEKLDTRNYKLDFRNPRWRSAGILHTLEKEELAKWQLGRVYPLIEPGDSIELMLLVNFEDKKPMACRGLVLSIDNNGVNTTVDVYTDLQGTVMRRKIPIWSPYVVSIKTLQKRYLHKGKKRVRKAKLFYLINHDHQIRTP